MTNHTIDCTSRLCAAFLTPLLFVAHGVAQGDFVNFETPVVNGLAVARVSGHDFLLVANTDDNSVEIYDTWNDAFMQRVPVGQGPVTVRWLPQQGRFLTVNYIGDSITSVDFGGSPPVAVVKRTVHVGDAPTDIVQNPVAGWNGLLTVLLSSQGSFAFVDPNTLALAGAFPIAGVLGGTFPFGAMKEPWRIQFAGNRSYTINLRGDTGFRHALAMGNTTAYRFALDRFDYSNGQHLSIESVGVPSSPALGSTNMGIAAASDGRVFIVGGLAHNDLDGTDALRIRSSGTTAATNTGFVSSHLWLITDSGSLTVTQRDLNWTAAGAVVGASARVSMPTDLALMEDSQGTLQKVFVTSFSTDRVVVLTALGSVPNDPKTWPSSIISIPSPTGGAYRMSGPRSLALKQASGTTGDPGSLLYCLNRLDYSISVIDPATNAHLRKIAMQRDPSPPIIRSARHFLYDATVSGGGMVSCASCHIDGRTDGMAWRLGGIVMPSPFTVVPNSLVDGPVSILISNDPTPKFWENKGLMVTQSLQGLLNHPVETQVESLFTNAPYHWRADKPGFTDFNEAFVNLMGATNLGPDGDPRGLSTTDMESYRGFINTIMYPPNPEQPLDRVYGGVLGNVNDPQSGSGLVRGLKAYHIQAVTTGSGAGQEFGRSCVQCHSLPNGSNSRITVGPFSGSPLIPGGGIARLLQPMETPGLRGIRAREAINMFAPGTARTSVSGLTHAGDSSSIEDFMLTTFGSSLSGPVITDVTAFVRAFDWGIAPLVGRTAEILNSSSASWQQLQQFEDQAKVANAGLALFAGRGNGWLGLYYDVTQDSYVIEGTPFTYTRGALQAAFLPGDVAIAQATPVGSERRIASQTGQRTALSGGLPSGVTLQPMRPATQWQVVPSLSLNADPTNGFFWGLGGTPGPGGTPKSLQAFFHFQTALVGSFGLTARSHEAPRRFRVTGVDIRLGAKVRIQLPNSTREIIADLHPTTALGTIAGTTNQRVWETTVEVAPLMLYALMCGGPHAPGVQATLDGTMTAVQPATFNSYQVRVENEDTTISPTGFFFPITL